MASDRFQDENPGWLPNRLPEDVDAERSLLATCCAPGMEARGIEVCADLLESDFVAPQHKALFAALRALHAEGVEVHALTLKDRLTIMGKLDALGGFSGLVDLLAGEELGRPEILAGLLRRKSGLRRLVREGARLVRLASEEALPPEDLARSSSARIMESGGTTAGVTEPMAAWREAEDLAADDREVAPAIPLPLEPMNRMMGGLFRSNVFVLAARPSLGKTALALQVALHAAQQGYKVGIWTLEMSRREILERLVSQLGHLQSGWSRRRLNPDERARLLHARDELKALRIFINDHAGTSPAMVRAALATARVHQEPFDLAVVDYLQLLSDDDPDRARRQTDASRVAVTSRAIKLMAKDFDLPFLLLSQLNREVEGRQGSAPRLSDLRDSGAVEQDADQVVFIHRRRIEGQPEAHTEFIVAKDRHGALGRVRATFQGERMRFRELSLETDPEPAAAGFPGVEDW